MGCGPGNNKRGRGGGEGAGQSVRRGLGTGGRLVGLRLAGWGTTEAQTRDVSHKTTAFTTWP